MASVESSGGKVLITPPASTVTAKTPLLLISVATTLWRTSSMIKEASLLAEYKPARSYNAQILLKVDDSGNTVVDKLVFMERKK